MRRMATAALTSLLTVFMTVLGCSPARALIGGTVAEAGYPALGSLQVEIPGDHLTPADHRCGVTLIAPGWAITASHCAQLGNATDVKTGAMRARVRFGSADVRSGGEVVDVTRFYRLGSPADGRARGYSWPDRDIALLQLARPVTGAQPIAIAKATPAAGTPARIMGWGNTCADPARTRDPQCYSPRLREADTAVQPTTACNTIDPTSAPQPLCIGAPDGRVTVGNADSGSPAWVQEDGRWVLAGILSGAGANDEKGPGLYMDVTKQRAWIDGIINGTARPEPDRVPDIAGAVRIGSGCVGSIVAPREASPDAPALVLTNGHCVDGDRPAPGKSLVDQPADREMQVLGEQGTAVASLRADRLVYATMTGTDVALYRLDTSYRRLAAQGVKVFGLATVPLRSGDAFTVKKLSTSATCTVAAVVPTLREGAWQQRDSVRYGGSSCQSSPGDSGSPLVSPDGRTVVGINNSSNRDGERCTEGNPCEVDASGAVSAVRGHSYGQQVVRLAACITTDSRFDAARPGCDLAAG